MTVLLAVGAVFGINLIVDAAAQNRLASVNERGATEGAAFYPSLVAERAASIRFISDPSPQNRTDLDTARTEVNNSLGALSRSAAEIFEALPADQRDPDSRFGTLLGQLPTMRSQVDGRTETRFGAYQQFNVLTDYLTVGNNAQAPLLPSPVSANSANRSGDLNRLADLVNRSTSLSSAAAVADDMTQEEYGELITVSGGWNALLAVLAPQLNPAEQERLAALTSSADWQRMRDFEGDILARGFGNALEAAPLNPVEAVEVGAIGQNMADQILRLGFERTAERSRNDAAEAAGTLQQTILIASLLFVGLVAAFLIALLVTTRLVRRLSVLRRETLTLAETVLPDAVVRLRKGERLDLDVDIPTLDASKDELGQVAAAFNQAQRTAVEAAVEEAATREGFNTAFLNIARRSQAILHQQMRVLDKIERAETNPDQLELLFSLDHLATRERRNAENLIILGGEQPRRQWRNPVPLGELVRAAVGESEHYQRVTVGSLPQAMVSGAAVGDLVHLMAELVDNATAFSPPAAPIEVHGTVVGRGVVVEVEDQGLGIEEEQLEQLNHLLSAPPDFGLFTLSRDSRIGLFVVARLATRHGVKVTLRSSAFGGVRAGVLIPTPVLAEQPAAAAPVQRTGGNGSVGNGSGGAPVPAGRPSAQLTGQNGNGHSNGNGNGHGNGGPVVVPSPTPSPEYTSNFPTHGGPPLTPTGRDEPGVLVPMPPRRPSPQSRHQQHDAPDRNSHELRGPDRRGPEPGGPGRGVQIGADGLPQLPRRSRQTHMDSRLLAPAGAPTSGGAPREEEGDLFVPPVQSPEMARSRMSALRRGSAQARVQDSGQDDRTERPRT